jgi:hypothetical protein
MKRQITTLCIFCGTLLLGAGAAETAEPVVVYTRPPSEIAEQENLEIVLRNLPAQRLKWAAFERKTLSYVVRQKSVGLLVPDSCEGLPIQIKIVSGKLQSAIYAKSGGRCKNGDPAGRKNPSGEPRYLTPDELFQRVAQADEQLNCYKNSRGCIPTSLYVTYDEKLGMPTKLEDYSRSVSDHYWSLEVSNIQLHP